MSYEYSIYVHIPFCKARCAYCAFSSCVDFSLENVYFEKLCDEILRVEGRHRDLTIRTMFWGGGTPSCVKLENLRKLFDVLSSVFDLSGLSEFSVECNPESVTEEKLNFFKSIGVNRLSFGLQSANDTTLAKIGRLHTYDGFLKALDIAMKSDFFNINADLILGLPEDMDEFQHTVDKVRNLPITHLSLYALEFHAEKTAFNALCDSYGYSDDDLADMYDFASRKFAEAGFFRYEISNFAKQGFRCAHNINYWREGRYFGFGASASGFVDNIRYGNAFDIKEYISGNLQPRCGEHDFGVATDYVDKISLGEEMAEFVMLGLRLIDGISLSEFTKRFDADFFAMFPAAENLIYRGFLSREKGRIRVPDEKLYVLNSVLVELLPD